MTICIYTISKIPPFRINLSGGSPFIDGVKAALAIVRASKTIKEAIERLDEFLLTL